ncbi:MAG: helix-turn-helix transcriptional regulator, partial [Limisphaerales bacterium]
QTWNCHLTQFGELLELRHIMGKQKSPSKGTNNRNNESPNPKGRDLDEGPRLRRRIYIHRAIMAREYPTVKSLAKDLNICDKTVVRYLKDLEDLNLPLAIDVKTKGYFYSELVDDFPMMHVTEREVSGLNIARQIIPKFLIADLKNSLNSILRKMTNGLSEAFSFKLSDSNNLISLRFSSEVVYDNNIITAIFRAVLKRKQLRLRYRKLGDKEFKWRLLDPYSFVNLNGEWYLFAYDHDENRKTVRCFTPVRMRDVEETGVVFKRPRDFDVEKYLENSFGIYSGEGIHDIVLRANPVAAEILRERKLRGQTKQVENPDGSLDIHLTLSSLVEVQRWLQGYNGKVIAVKPFELQNMSKEGARELFCETEKLQREQGVL